MANSLLLPGQPPPNRRDFLRGAGLTIAGAALGGSGLLTACSSGKSSGGGSVSGASTPKTVSVGALQDLSGGLEIYGSQQAQATMLAVETINAAGGVLGRKLDLHSNNTQSQDALNVQYARSLLKQDGVAVVVGSLTSSSREAMRPIFDQNKGLLFYPSLYEGGLCDQNVFVTGPSASQQIKPLVEYALKNLGKSFYILAPDYNFGTTSAVWYKKYIAAGGGKVVGTEFLPLTTSNFASTISHIQAAKPDVVVALPVGSSQTGFFAQFASAGLKKHIAVISTNYGSGNQQVAISAAAGEGVIVCLEYVPSVNNAANTTFKSAWTKRFKGGSEQIIDEAANTWTAWNLWAAAAEKAGSTDAPKVIAALRDGITFNSPSGLVKADGATNHLIRPMYIAKGNKKHGFDIVQTIDNVAPEYEQSVCNLIKNPGTHRQFVPTS